MITPVELAELVPERPDRFTPEETVSHAEEIIRAAARAGMSEACIGLVTDRAPYLMHVLNSWGFTSSRTDYTSGWSTIKVEIVGLPWFSTSQISQDRRRRAEG